MFSWLIRVNKRERVDSVEQYGRRQNLEIVGIRYEKGKDTNQIVMDVA